MKKLLVISLLLLILLSLNPSTSTADYPTGTLNYSDKIAVGETFEWTVKTVELTGYFNTYQGMFYIGEKALQEGQKVKLTVLEDPDTASGIWYDIYVNDARVINPTSVYLGIGMMVVSGNFLISPVTYTNTSGTYDLYEELFDELRDSVYEYMYTYNYVATYSGGFTIIYTTSDRFLVNFEDNVFSFFYEEYYRFYSPNGMITGDEEITIRYVAEVNTITGLLEKSEMLFDINTDTTVAKLHFLIESDYEEASSDWLFSLISIPCLAVLITLTKRKRK